MKITACDLDKQTPAKTYTITPEGEEPVDLDLCGTHAAPIEELIQKAKGAQVAAPEEADDEVRRSVPVRRSPRKAAAKKAPAKKTASKSASRAPKIMTLEEIEEQKRNKG
ncbi:hypothetical protein ABZ114_02805 [Streptomyces albidoflavus]|uniref:hypothetical protein n=1 Tax=Streptomyces albidoflavus TaxID=1886 RepID=UPI0033BADED8